MGSFFSIGSHQKVLDYAIRVTRGAVLECGLGYFSTPILHALCCPSRLLVSLENEPQWVRLFSGFACDGHVIELIESTTEAWGKNVLRWAGQCKLSVVLVDQDHDTWVNRTAVSVALIDRAEILVIHDVGRYRKSLPKAMRVMLAGTKYVRRFSGSGLNFGTIAASQTIDVSAWPEMEG